MQTLLPLFVLLVGFLMVYPTFLLQRASRQLVRLDVDKPEARSKAYQRENPVPDDRC